MTPLRMMASGLAAPAAAAVLALLTCSTSLAAHAPGLPLADPELASVHAAGLSEPALDQLALGAAAPTTATMPWLETLAHADRQQTLSQARFAAVTAQGTVGLVQGVGVATLALPVATLFIPSILLPFPLLMTPPLEKSDSGH